ncbi:DUF58 domain-containing protein [Brucepastera parasyntrophica]|uniref:DUF58 domain-containing protein n=1 Tax=Brucepastera parasyntrophica TaxID=2880008 RepID=UPI0021087F66|nr:DUF58 domain-containing protein [Brucepastera parasyntrophica]ULQ60704.1 DUF58 domain-containing protein [Brucepastera parasyntrophica]
MEKSYIAARAKYLKLAAFSISEGMLSGWFLSRFRGQGMEFDSVREYEPGDDIRFIDRNVTARSGKPFVKIFREERDLTLFLVVDASLSMNSIAGPVSGWEKALETAALLAFAAEQNACPLGAVSFGASVEKIFSPRQGRDYVLTVLSALERTSSGEPGSALANALAGTAKILRSRSLVVIISDFRISGYEKSLGLLARKHDVIAVRITPPASFPFPDSGFLDVADPEMGMHKSFPTGSKTFRSQWERDQKESLMRWKHICLRRNVSPLILSTGDDAVYKFSSFFSDRRSKNTRE